MPDTSPSFHSLTFTAVVVSAAQDLFEMLAAADTEYLISQVLLSQHSDAGDAMSELLPVQLIRGYTTTGSGGTAAVPANMKPSGRASTLVAAKNNTTLATVGTPEVIISDAWNIQANYRHEPIRQERVHFRDGQRMVFRLSAAPADALTCSCTILFEERRMSNV